MVFGARIRAQRIKQQNRTGCWSATPRSTGLKTATPIRRLLPDHLLAADGIVHLRGMGSTSMRRAELAARASSTMGSQFYDTEARGSNEA